MLSWFAKPETIYATVLFALGILVSLFGPELKQFYKASSLKVNEKIILNTSIELARLDRLHNNAYELVLWALWGAVSVAKYSLYLMVALALFTIVDVNHLRQFSFPVSLTTLLAGGFVGRGFHMFETVKALYDYENHTAKLRKRIEEAKKALAAPAD